jgi:hypothetical protein
MGNDHRIPDIADFHRQVEFNGPVGKGCGAVVGDDDLRLETLPPVIGDIHGCLGGEGRGHPQK